MKAIYLTLVFTLGLPSAHAANWYLVAKREVSGAVKTSSLQQALKGRWDGAGRPAFAVHRVDSKQGADEFRSITGQSIDRYVDDWNIRLFAGRDVPPRFFSSIQDSLDFVSGTKGGVVLIWADPERQQTLDWTPLRDLKRD